MLAYILQNKRLLRMNNPEMKNFGCYSILFIKDKCKCYQILGLKSGNISNLIYMITLLIIFGGLLCVVYFPVLNHALKKIKKMFAF